MPGKVGLLHGHLQELQLVQGTVRGAAVSVGSPSLSDWHRTTAPRDQELKMNSLSREGKTMVYVFSGRKFAGVIALADIIREESRDAVRRLSDSGIRVAMVTGDSEDVARWVASELGISEYFSKVLPGEKAEMVKRLQYPEPETEHPEQIPKHIRSSGFGSRDSTVRRVVAMVGDGVNDAPALAQADVGIAIGAGTNVAVESAGIILVRNDPRDIPKIIRLSKLTYSKMIQNLFWATGYNVAALPLAAGALFSQGIVLNPAVAALFMSLSTVIVAINAVYLRRAVL